MRDAGLGVKGLCEPQYHTETCRLHWLMQGSSSLRERVKNQGSDVLWQDVMVLFPDLGWFSRLGSLRSMLDAARSDPSGHWPS